MIMNKILIAKYLCQLENLVPEIELFDFLSNDDKERYLKTADDIIEIYKKYKNYHGMIPNTEVWKYILKNHNSKMYYTQTYDIEKIYRNN